MESIGVRSRALVLERDLISAVDHLVVLEIQSLVKFFTVLYLTFLYRSLVELSLRPVHTHARPKTKNTI